MANFVVLDTETCPTVNHKDNNTPKRLWFTTLVILFATTTTTLFVSVRLWLLIRFIKLTL